MVDKPLTARDILAGRGPQQSLQPYDDPTWAGQLGHRFEQGASGLGAGPSVTSSAGEIGQTLGGILGSMSLHDALPNLQEAYNRFRYGQPVQGAMSVLSALPMVPEAGMARGVGADAIETAVKEAAPPIVAYHGSPYSFDRFDSSKIGTGEGAQAYGHGLYFADNEGVAKSYRDALTGGKWAYAGQPSSENWDASALDYLDRRVVDEQGMPAAFNEAIGRLQNSSKFYNDTYGGSGSNLYDNAVARLQRMDPSQVKPAGSMYQVGINADPNSFLDWDKPFNQQSPTVQQALSGIVSPQDAAAYHFGYAPEEFASLPADRQTQLIAQTPSTARDNLLPQTGADVVKKFGGGAEAAEALNNLGIPGIKYLDQGSRAAGDGTGNYVLFNDSLASILKKYGLAGLGTAGGAAALTAGGGSSMSPVSPAEAAPAPDPQQPPPPIGSSPQYDDWWRQLQQQRFDQAG